MKERKNSSIEKYLWFIPLPAVVVPGIVLAARHDDPVAIAAGVGASLAVAVVAIVVAKWLLGRKAE